MSKSYLSFTIILLLSALLISSCKRDAPVEDFAVIEVDFLLNETDLEKFGLEFTPQDFERDNEDPNRVLTVMVGEPVKFKDTTKGSTATSSRKWALNGDEWKEVQNDKEIYVPEFTKVFEEAGYYKITLHVGDASSATKLIKVVSGDYAGPTATDDTDETVADVDEDPARNEVVEETPIVAKEDPARSTPPAPRPKATNPEPVRPPAKPVEPAKITSIKFSAPSEVTVGQTFEIRDLSAPSNAINVRNWDFGNGSTQRQKGSSYNQMYFAAGEFTITLCLNDSNQCTSKRVMVKPRPARKEVATTTPPKPKPPVAKKPEVSKVEFKIPSSATVGESVSFADRSQPSSAVMKRQWTFGDGTANLNTGKGTVSHIFQKAGSFTVKLCLNDDSSKCTTQSITIKDKAPVVVAAPPVAPKPSTSTASVGGFDMSSYDGSRTGRVGLLSSQKCDETSFEWHTGAAYLNITPIKPLELEEAKVYADKNGTVDIILTTGDSKETGVLKNVQVNPGSSVIYLTDLAIILEPGEKYTLMIKPSAGSSDLKLENAAKCSPKPLGSDVVGVNYNSKFVLYDLKFYY